MQLGILTGDHKTASRHAEKTGGYWHRSPSDGAPTYCGISTVGAVSSGGPAWGTQECPVCARA